MNAPKKPRVALTMRVTKAADYVESRDSISHDWLARLEAWDMMPVLIPNALADPVEYLAGVRPAILVLTGGDDLGDTPERDRSETMLLDHALAENLPVLGVCRGMQLINTRLGGGTAPVSGHVAKPHPVSVSGGWEALYGENPEVNSYHNVGIAGNQVASGMVACALDGDGHVEAFYHREKAVAGVMWHPERDVPLDGDRRVIEHLATKGTFPA